MLLIGIPVILLTRYDPMASYFTQAAIVFLVCVSMLLLIFLPKIKIMRKTRLQSGTAFNMRAARYISWRSSDDNENLPSTTNVSTENYLRARIRELEQSLEKATAAKSQPAKDVGEICSKEPPTGEDRCTSASKQETLP